MILKKDEVVFLLGAGASVEAGIPASGQMIEKLEKHLREHPDWKEYSKLYNYLKSAIMNGHSLRGVYDHTKFNIEDLVSTLDDLQRGDEHPLFPFIGSWAPKLPEVAGSNLVKLAELRQMIVKELRDNWVQLKYDRDAGYFSGLARFQQEYQHPLRVFTLNYDLCVEKGCHELRVERGFGDARHWDWRVFDESADSETPNIYLYKLHGSIDWTRDDALRLVYQNSPIEPTRIEIIFGTTYKLQYVDPFLYFAYELRRWTITSARLVVTVGYSFADEHINGILGQALAADPKKRLLAVGPEDADRHRSEIASRLKRPSDTDQIACRTLRAKEFFDAAISVKMLSEVFPDEEEPFVEVKPIPASPPRGAQQ